MASQALLPALSFANWLSFRSSGKRDRPTEESAKPCTKSHPEMSPTITYKGPTHCSPSNNSDSHSEASDDLLWYDASPDLTSLFAGTPDQSYAATLADSSPRVSSTPPITEGTEARMVHSLLVNPWDLNSTGLGEESVESARTAIVSNATDTEPAAVININVAPSSTPLSELHFPAPSVPAVSFPLTPGAAKQCSVVELAEAEDEVKAVLGEGGKNKGKRLQASARRVLKKVAHAAKIAFVIDPNSWEPVGFPVCQDSALCELSRFERERYLY